MEFEMLASGYGLLEAPRVDDLGRLYFSDIPNAASTGAIPAATSRR